MNGTLPCDLCGGAVTGRDPWSPEEAEGRSGRGAFQRMVGDARYVVEKHQGCTVRMCGGGARSSNAHCFCSTDRGFTMVVLAIRANRLQTDRRCERCVT